MNEFWKQGLWIKHICFDGSLYTALFNSNQKYAQQTVSHQTSLEDLKRFIKEYWNKVLHALPCAVPPSAPVTRRAHSGRHGSHRVTGSMAAIV